MSSFAPEGAIAVLERLPNLSPSLSSGQAKDAGLTCGRPYGPAPAFGVEPMELTSHGAAVARSLGETLG